MKVKKSKIRWVADYIVGSAHDGLPIEVALVNAKCSYKEFKKIKKHKLIKNAINEYRLIITAHYLNKQVKYSNKSK